MTNYPTGDFLIRVKNAAMAGVKEVTLPSTKMVKATAVALKKAGFLAEVEDKKGILGVSLTFKNKKPAILGLRLVSRPGLRIYMGASEIEKIKSPSIFLLSTPKGIISSREAVKERAGGEVIVEVW